MPSKMNRPAGALQKKMAAFCTDSTACFQSEMRKIFFMRGYDTPPDEQQTEGSRKQTKAAQRADLLHNNRSAANSLAQTIGAASLSTREAQVKSTASPPHLRERRSQPRSAAGEPTPPSAPQAGIFRSGPRATRFAAAALLSSLGSRSCCSQQRSSSTACRSRACERASLLFTIKLLLQIFCCFFREGTGRAARRAPNGIPGPKQK